MYGWMLDVWVLGGWMLGGSLLHGWKVWGPWVWQECWKLRNGQLFWKKFWMAHLTVHSKHWNCGWCCRNWWYACWYYNGIQIIWNIVFQTFSMCLFLILLCLCSFILLMKILFLSKYCSCSWLFWFRMSLNFWYWSSLCLSRVARILFMFLICS